MLNPARTESLSVAFGQTDWGRIVVAASERGVCALAMGDDDDSLLHELGTLLPRCRFAPGPVAGHWLAQMLGAWRSGDSTDAIPLDVHGTPFQVRVWDALRTIPRGETRSYAQLARQLGSPGAGRAVGSACGANRIAILIPCHRVLREDGQLGGFRWGLRRKVALLESERSSLFIPAAR